MLILILIYAVEEAHDALDYGDVRALRTVAEERGDQVFAAEERVEVPGGAAGREGVVAGIDVVGADFVTGHG
jgi:hypothetical protein